MNYFKTVMATLWVHVKNHLGTIGRYVLGKASPGRTMARDCLSRTKAAYYAITHFPIKDQITEHHLDSIVRSATSNAELLKMLEQAGIYDEVYSFLLIMVIFEVYKASSPPELDQSNRPKLIK